MISLKLAATWSHDSARLIDNIEKKVGTECNRPEHTPSV